MFVLVAAEQSISTEGFRGRLRCEGRKLDDKRRVGWRQTKLAMAAYPASFGAV